ncbi:hypothetical protein ACW0JT_06410 [Arthrobacter sp. SA17]
MIYAPADTGVRLRKAAALGLVAGLLLTGCGRANEAASGTETGKAIAAGAATGTINLWAQGGKRSCFRNS